MDTWVWDQVSLELGKIDVEGTIESEGSGDGGDDLTNQSVKIGVGWSFDIQVTSADIVDSLIINHESTVRVFKGSMGCQNRIVGFNNCCSYLRSRVNGELQFRLFAIIHRKPLHQQ